jgi:hypothetical protein
VEALLGQAEQQVLAVQVVVVLEAMVTALLELQVMLVQVAVVVAVLIMLVADMVVLEW